MNTTSRSSAVTRPQARPRAAQLAWIAWHRGYRFAPGMPRLAPPSWPIRLWAFIAAVAVWPVQLMQAAAEAGAIRTYGCASATVKPSTQPNRPGVAAAAAAMVLVVYAALMLVALTVPALFASALLIPGIWALIVIVYTLLQAVNVLRRPDARGLTRRRQELAATGPAYTLAWVMAARPGTGDGARLINALADEWAAEHAVTVLYPATPDLAAYYRNLGATADPGTDRQLFDNRQVNT